MNEFERKLLDITQNSAWLATVARKDRRIIGIDYYNYNTTIENIASGAAGQGVITIQSDSDFALTYMSGLAVVNNAVVNGPVTTIQFTDTGTGKTFFSGPTLFTLTLGAAGLPFYLPAPRVLAPNTNIQINLTNLSSAAASTYYIALMGARIYYGN